MKRDVFTRYVEAVCSIYNTTPEVLFTNGKHTFRDAKNILLYVCLNKHIRQSEIIDWTQEFYNIKLTRNSISRTRIFAYVQNLIDKDEDFNRLISKINSI
jgi:hypothetical protein